MMGMLLALLIAWSSPADWTKTSETLAQSVVYIESQTGSCTGFVIRTHAKGDKTLVLTAAHCYGQELYADHAAAKVVYKDGKHDLMILETDDLDRPAVAFAAKNPAQGEELASFGFGMALDKPMLRIAHVSNAAIELPDVEGGPFVMIDAGYVPGQSGGPCVNAAGEIVSIVQRANGLLGIGQGVEQIRERIKRYLEKPAKP